jgi:hypothetical protein
MRLFVTLLVTMSLLPLAGCGRRQQAKTQDQTEAILAELNRDSSRQPPPHDPRLDVPPNSEPKTEPKSEPKTQPKTGPIVPPRGDPRDRIQPPAPPPPPPPPARVYKPEDPAAREQAIEAIRAAGSGFDVDKNAPGEPVIVVRMGGARGTRTGDGSLGPLRSLPNVRRVVLSYTSITDAGLETLGAMTQLEELDISNNNRITDTGLANLRGLVNLQRLDVRSTKVTDAGITELRRTLPRLIVER